MLKYYDFDCSNSKITEEALDKKNIYELEKFVNQILSEKDNLEEAKILIEFNDIFLIYYTKYTESYEDDIKLTDEQKDFIKKFIKDEKIFDEEEFVIEFRKGD